MADDELLDRRRAQVGASLLASVAGERAVARTGDGWWLVLTGAPSADGNTGLVFSDDPDVVRDVVAQVERAGCPAVLMTAGSAPDHVLPASWQREGSMPLMSVELAATRTAHDPRARRAEPPDVPTVVALVAEVFGLEPEIAAAVVEPVVTQPSEIDFWLLEHAGAAVSTVMTARCEEVVTIWCMATRPDCARRGFGGALLAHVLAGAAEDGAVVGLLGASPAGEPLYRSTGWVTLEDWRVHVNAPSVQHTH